MTLATSSTEIGCIENNVIDKILNENFVDTSSLKTATDLKKAKPINPDASLVWRTLSGETAAFDQLVIKYKNNITNLVGSYVKDFDMVKDVVQETFIRAYNALGKYRFESKFYTWLYRIAVNTSYSYLSSQQSWLTKVEPMENHSDYEYVGPITLEPEKSSLNDDLRDAINMSISKLPIKLRTALLLRETEGLSYEEISSVLSCELGTVKSRISRAREHVMADLSHLYEKTK